MAALKYSMKMRVDFRTRPGEGELVDIEFPNESPVLIPRTYTGRRPARRRGCSASSWMNDRRVETVGD